MYARTLPRNVLQDGGIFGSTLTHQGTACMPPILQTPSTIPVVLLHNFGLRHYTRVVGSF